MYTGLCYAGETLNSCKSDMPLVFKFENLINNVNLFLKFINVCVHHRNCLNFIHFTSVLCIALNYAYDIPF